MRYVLKYSFCFLIAFLPIAAKSQSNAFIDSLERQLAKAKNIDDSIKLLCQLTWNISATDTNKAMHYGQMALINALRIRDKKLRSEAYDAAALSYWLSSNFVEAKRLYNTSLKIAEENKLLDRIGYCNENLAQIALSEGNLLDAQIYAIKSRNAFFRINFYAKVIANDWFLIKKGRGDIAKAYSDSALHDVNRAIANTTEQSTLIFYYLDLTRLYSMLENRSKAIKYVLKALEIADSEKNQKGILKSYYQIADYLSNYMHNYEIALVYYQKIHEIAIKSGNNTLISESYNNIGYTYKQLGNDSLAMVNYQKSLQLANKANHRHSKANAYKNIGEFYFQKSDFQNAQLFYNKCITTGCDQCQPIVFHKAYVDLGKVYLNAKDIVNAKLCFERSLQLADSADANNERAVSLMNIADFYKITTNNIQALAYYQRAMNTSISANSLSLQKEISYKLSQLYTERNDFRSAYKYLTLSKTLADSIQFMNDIDNLSRLEARFELQNLKHQKEIENAKANEEINKQAQLKTLFIIGFVSMAIVGLIAYIGWRRKKRDNALLAKQKNQIEKLADQVHESDQMKLRFFTNISHELRTPLTLIMGLTEDTRQSAGAKPNVESLFYKIRKHTEKLAHTVNQILDIRRLDNGSMEVSMVNGDITSYISGIVANFEGYAAQKGIELKFEADTSSITGLYDPDKLEKILSNLISNAIKFSSKGSAVNVKLGYSATDSASVNIVVSDTGIGVPSDKIENIFNPYYRVSDSVPGTGIGLTLTRELVTLLNGTINVESTPGKGSVFTVKLPIQNGSDSINIGSPNHISSEVNISAFYMDEPAEKNAELSLSEPEPDEQSILIVEDNADLRQFIANIFADSFIVYMASDGKEGLSVAQKKLPNIIISDIMMPVMDGLALCEAVKKNPNTSHIPILLLTAKNTVENKLTGFAIGADEYIEKPFNSALLKGRVENIIKQRRKLIEKFSNHFQLEPGEIIIPDLEKEFLEKAIKIIENKISDPALDVDFLASELGVSRTQLYRKLKALTDYSANQFIRIIRLKRAAQIFQHGQHNISEVMFETGFSNYSYFASCFKEYFGKTPKEYILFATQETMN